MNLKDKVRSIPNWPIEGVTFRDITTVLQDPEAFRYSIDLFYDRYKTMQIDKIVGIDARGFIFGAVLAYKLNLSFIPVRKKGKLPFKTISAEYDLEYGKDTVEMHEDAIQKGDRVLVVDDLIATGGTVAAAVELVQKLGGSIVECAFLLELTDLKGQEKIKGVPIFSLIEFEGE
ncbi:MAG: adenine phosphoribosyltransferase [Deltaproteobacteria bacterium]|jgi:adenine phosphoribosyltransferase|nr:adenine phosphoribosyltransferase [Deltaproteobacteria bacterium]MBT4642983.1 adenine phosphoribosyltransferase [Deltaproteobacteria bacterium]MBT6501083.1 adenine phosphoribosyltransferase [Deltaproteobacteria bacterium]MBT6613493.1 adenine phosphoribosyltransferase [Deltaproteobacteria bacterium]MBT7155451.1 adenine phosphoribosyltransferase [Deltaproteobacteria bacterium]